MRSVRNSARMQRDRSRFNTAPRPEIAAHVEQNLIRLNVIMHPWNSHCLRMRIQHSWRKCADNVTANLECLMDRRRLVDCAGNRLEILRIKRKRIDVTIPTNDIEWMMCHGHL